MNNAVIPNTIESIKKVNVLTDRLKKRREEWEEAKPIICPESSISFTESWKKTEGLHLNLRWAEAFSSILKDTPAVIRDGELIVGSLTRHIRGVDFITAFNPQQVLQMLNVGVFDRRLSEASSALISKDDAKILRDDAQYWADHIPPDYVNKALTRELGEDHLDLLMDRSMIIESLYCRAEQERGIFQDFAGIFAGLPQPHSPVLDKGLNAIIAMAKAEQEKMEKEGFGLHMVSPQAYVKHTLLESIIISCQAVIGWANKYAITARTLARTEKDPARKKELEQIAEHCDWVPAKPPRSYWEALQSLRFIHMTCLKEQPDRRSNNVGRLDQMLFPYYEKDLKEAKITRQEAAELLGCFWLKTRESEILEHLKKNLRAVPGTLLANVTIGGRDAKGKDVTNELSYIVLEVMRQMRLSEPAVYIRYHDGMSKDFLLYVLECNLDMAGGNPAFLNDKLGTERYVSRGVKLEDAADWDGSGCLAYHLECSEHVGGGMNLNQAKIFEVALNNGIDPRTGKQIGLKTGNVAAFNSIEQVYEAFFKQLDYFCDRMRKDYLIRRSVDLSNAASSGWGAAMLFEDCIPNGLAPLNGGARYPITCNEWIGDRGITDVSDCLTAIKYLVFDKKIIAMSDLLDALKANWEGKETISQACLKAPKYGNDDDYADNIFNFISMKTQEIMQSRPDPFTGLKPFLFKGAAGGHIPHGMVVGALPNGRKAWTPLNDGGTSAMPGMDVKGPTALINSATKWDHAREEMGIVHNMKFSRQMFNSPKKLESVLELLKTFFARGGWHIQFNIHNAEDLLDAKLHPENWKNLIVRVAGYSAYFVDLPASLQDEIIARTQHQL